MNAIETRKWELENCRPDPTLDEETVNAYWERMLAQHADRPLDVTRTPEATPYPLMEVSQVTYKGFDETPIHCWHIQPAAAGSSDVPRPCIVKFQGYTGDRGFPERYAPLLIMGYSVLAVDIRGQGGETGNLLPMESGVRRGWITQGIMDKERSYYMALAIDAVRAVETAALLPGVDPNKIAVNGGSQGGGLSLLAGALSKRVAAIVADIPNMCRLDFGVLNSTSSLTEIADYIKRYPERMEAILENLAYFDMVNLAPRIEAPVLVSVGWKDTVCMPETIYAAYHRIRSPKQICDYPFSGHEVGELHNRRAAEFMLHHLGGVAE